MADAPQHVLTVEYLVTLVGLAVLIGGAIWKIRAQLDEKIDREVDAVKATMAEHQQHHSDFKLEVAQTYASREHLKETEERLVTAITKLEATVAAMPASIAALIKTGRASQRSRS
jgi:hypothetical protein